MFFSKLEPTLCSWGSCIKCLVLSDVLFYFNVSKTPPILWPRLTQTKVLWLTLFNMDFLLIK
jgi:hypothetical protein